MWTTKILKLIFRESTISRQQYAEIGIFAGKLFGQGMYVDDYFECLMCLDMSWSRDPTMKYEEQIKKVTGKRFQKFGNRLYEKVVEGGNLEHDDWIVPSPICSMC